MKHLYLYVGLLSLLCCALPSAAQTADFIASKYSGCAPLAVDFTDKSTGTSGSTLYAWDFGDGKTSTLKDPSTTYGLAGTYSVKLTVKNGSSGAPSTRTIDITVYPAPSVDFTATPSSGCPCLSVHFKNTSTPSMPGPYSVIWSFGDGNLSTDEHPDNVYCTSGYYDVLLKVTNSAGCISSRKVTRMINVLEAPDASFTASKTELCKVPEATTFTPAVGKGKSPYTYYWDFGDATSSTVPSPTHTYTAAGVFTVKLIVTDANGCKDTSIQKDYIIVGKTASFSAPEVCWGGTTTFTNTTYPAPSACNWDFGDGKTATGTPVSHYYDTSGIFTVRLINSYPGGCQDTFYKSYQVHDKPKADFSFDPIYPCPAPVTVNFTNKSKGAVSYVWLFGDGGTSSSANPSYTYTRNGMFLCYLIARSTYGCADTFRVRDTSKKFPKGYPGLYYDSSNSPILIRVYDANPEISGQFKACLPVPFKPSIALKTTTYLPLSDDTCRGRKVTGFDLPFWRCRTVPKPDPYPDPYYDPPYRLGDTAKEYPYKIVSWSWDFGDGFTAADSSPSHTYTTEGEYLVKVTVTTENGCTFTASVKVERGNMPVADFEFTDYVCKKTPIYFKNTSTGGLGTIWCFGDMPCTDTLTGMPSMWHGFGLCDTVMPVVLMVLRYGCIDTQMKNVRFKPGFTVAGAQFDCSDPLNVAFNALDCSITSVRWYFGDGDSSDVKELSHRYPAMGTYTVKRKSINEANGCSFENTFNIILSNPTPILTASDTAICKGDSVTFDITNHSEFTFFRWYINGTYTEERTGRKGYRFKDTGLYTIMMVASDRYDCKDTIIKKDYIIVGKPYPSIIASPLKGCSPVKISVDEKTTDTRGAYVASRRWHWADGSADDTGKRMDHIYTLPAVYRIFLEVTDNIGCSDTTSIAADIRLPKADFRTSVDTFGCIGAGITYNNYSTGKSLSYLWDFGDGSTATTTSPVHAYDYLGAYTVKLKITDDIGCTDSITKSDFIKLTKPKAGFIHHDTFSLCPPLFDTITNTSTGATSYYWDFNNGSFSSLENPIGTFTDPRRYTIMLIAYNRYGCADTAYGKVRVLGYDGSIKYGPLAGCAPLDVNFEIEQFNAAVMLIDYADGTTEDVIGKKTSKHTYKSPGAYVPQLIFGDGKECSSFSKGLDTIKVDGVFPHFTNTSACLNELITFEDSSYSLFSEYASSLWLIDGKSKTGKTVTHVFNKPGTYSITLVSTNKNGCIASVTRILEIRPLPVITTKDTVICLGDRVVLVAGGAATYKWTPHPTLSCSDCDAPVAKPLETTSYFVTGTDVYGCKGKGTVRIGIKYRANIIYEDSMEVCARQSLQLSATGATRYLWSPDTYLDSPAIAKPVTTPETTIRYRVVGFEAACIPDTGYVNVTVHPMPQVNAGPDQQILAGTEAQLKGEVRDGNIYLWTPPDYLSCTNCLQTISRPAAGAITYTLKATSVYGCSDSDKVRIELFCDNSQLYLPNTFTPNGDGENDYFYPQGQGVYKVNSFIVYNRWGQKMYERSDMEPNVKELGWNGRFNNEELGPDTYVYTIEIQCQTGAKLFQKGDVTLIK